MQRIFVFFYKYDNYGTTCQIYQCNEKKLIAGPFWYFILIFNFIKDLTSDQWF